MKEKRDLQWWLSQLDGVTKVGDEYMALCPGHDDLKASLSISPTSNGDVLVHCFAGCSYEHILECLGGSQEKPRITIKKVSTRITQDSRSWWEAYTGIPAIEWEVWGVAFEENSVAFTWENLKVRKLRQAGSKEFNWDPPGWGSPPLWPYPKEVTSRIFLCEGESDTGVLRHLGLVAYAMTKGASTPLEGALASLKELGVREVVAVLDADKGGREGEEKLSKDCLAVGLKFLPFPTQKLVNPLTGEKDLRDFWLRCRDTDLALKTILELIPEPTTTPVSFVTLDEFLGSQQTEEDWLVKDVWLSGTIGVIAGAPKMYKSWLALDLALSVASGTRFLGTFEAPDPGAVVFVPKEDPNFLLQDRLVKIMLSKGLGGRLSIPHIQFPERGIPFYLDLTREFLFTPDGSQLLFDYLDRVASIHGRIRAVFFDPILRMLLGIDEYKASEVSETVFSVASRIQRDYQAAVILVHHRSKGGADIGKRSYGSIAFHAFSESSLYLKGEEPDPDGWVEVMGEFKSSQPTYWAYRFPDLANGYYPEVKKKEDSGDLKTKILQVLARIDEGVTSEELLSVVSASDFLVRKVLKDLQESGEIDCIIQKGGPGKPGKRLYRLH